MGEEVALAASRAPPGARFCIAGGVHRLQSIEPKAGQSFYGERGAVLNGARILSGFVRHGTRWVATVPRPPTVERGVCEDGGVLCRLPLAVFLDGQPLRRVHAGEVGPGRFFYDPAAREVTLGDDPRGRMVEASEATFAFTGTAPSVRIVGLTVERYANPAQEGAVRGLGPGWRVEHSEFRFNSGAGVSIDAEGAVLDCLIHSNGQLGATGDGNHLVFAGNRIWNNNIFGFSASWEAGGIKVTDAREVTFRDNHVAGNRGPGLWCDERCGDVLIEGNHVERNEGAGIFFELSAGATIQDNRIVENGQAKPGWYWGADIQIAASEEALVTGNEIVVRPGGRAIMLIDQNRHRLGGGYYRTRGNRVIGNRVVFLGDGAAGGVSDAPPGAANFGIIESGGNVFDRNRYAAPAGARVRFVWGRTATDFVGFRKRGQEAEGESVLLPTVANQP
ncbi:right-handed parallel beta-helix repeat-containing protein [Enterovirga aerilata]|uniref:Right-handed parallel beta-helix repeat-containing protein n=1 Tax=Enterovirga aerilata TaxID=2730920 RepID=A0A849IDK9_9HYPH|nr:right-handed parallel beta-helix repeat-containing protein [Enterovirga sp. DB1703]NNM74067.1 right-handed parallel beta-helix repeat-containing protein [Enterovirga sp. DB1703]